MPDSPFWQDKTAELIDALSKAAVDHRIDCTGFHVPEGAFLDEPKSHNVAINIDSLHYTSCLINARGNDQLPLFARDNPVTFSDDNGNKFFVGIFSTVSLQAVNLDSDAPSAEFCHAYLTENSGRLAKSVPEAKRIQSSKCFGLATPGYDPDPVALFSNATALGVTSKTTVNGKYLYSQTPIPYTLLDLTATKDNIFLDTYHTHYADSDERVRDSPYYGYFMRVFNSERAAVNVTPVQPHFGEHFAELFGSNVDPTDIHSCFSIESFKVAGANHVNGVSLLGHYDTSASPTDFLENFDQHELRAALQLDTRSQGNTNLEDIIYDMFEEYIHPYGATGFEFHWMSTFRTVSGILDFLYIFLVFAQAKVNGRYPSKRFDGVLPFMFCHILSGCILIWGGAVIHFYNEYSQISVEGDKSKTWQVLYMFGVAGVTVFGVVPRVMGEKRITIPLYLAAGAVNLANAVVLLSNPTLKNAFLLWGSVNTFIYVRAYVTLLSFAHIDYELLYTYAILAAGATTYPLSAQNPNVFYFLVCPILYGPFHERVCQRFPFLGFTEEDWAW